MKLFKSVVKMSIVALCSVTLMAGSVSADDDFEGYKNVIVLVPDGCDETVQTLARWYKGEDLQVDKMDKASQKQHMANSVITGSAAAATAFATGHKTTVRFLGIGPRTDDLLTGFVPTADPYAPVASILEAAKLKGKATGIVVTSRVTHATPAAFASHIQDRGWDNDIMEHMVYNNVDVVFGGGARHLIPSGDSYTTTFGDVWGGKRTDGENLMDVLLDRGYQFVDSKYGMSRIKEGKVWGLFDDSHMDADIDRSRLHPTQPSIAEMTAKAIKLLKEDDDGFFLMVEGSQVDWAGHNNDPIWMVTDFIAFDDAVKVACNFARKDGETLVLAYPDHNTGGMKIGHNYTTMGYTETTIEDLVGPLKGMTMSANGVVSMMEGDYSAFNIISNIEEHWGLDIDPEDEAKIAEEIIDYADVVGMSYSLANVISKYYTVIGWSTHGHNGETVPVWVYPGHAPVGTIDNTELAFIAADAMDVKLNKTTKKLYVDLDTATLDYEIVDDGLGNLTVEVADAQLPISKDYMINAKGKMIKLPGITVYAPATGKVYVSKKALRKLKL